MIIFAETIKYCYEKAYDPMRSVLDDCSFLG